VPKKVKSFFGAVVYLSKIYIAMLTDNLFASLASIVVPKDYLNDFEIVS
jgi:hypothetical protein